MVVEEEAAVLVRAWQAWQGRGRRACSAPSSSLTGSTAGGGTSTSTLAFFGRGIASAVPARRDGRT